jgi:hypothetical protein
MAGLFSLRYHPARCLLRRKTRQQDGCLQRIKTTLVFDDFMTQASVTCVFRMTLPAGRLTLNL